MSNSQQPTASSSLPAGEYFTHPGLIAALAYLVGHVYTASFQGTSLLIPAGLLLAALVGFLLTRRPGLSLVISFVLLFAGIGSFRETQSLRTDRAGIAALSGFGDGGAPFTVATGTVESMPARSSSAWTILLSPGCVIESGGMRQVIPALCALRVPTTDATNLILSDVVPGDRVSGAGALLELPTAGGGGEQNQWVRARGAVALVRAKTIARRSGDDERGAWGEFLAVALRTANAAEGRLQKWLSPRSAGIAVAMTLGRTHHLSNEQRVAFRRTGLMHLFAVSGLHTMLVGGLVIALLRLFGLRPAVRLVLLLVILLFFAALVGLRASVLRAAILLLLSEGRHLLRRPIEPLSALGTVATILMAQSPRAVWQIDFQMTFLCALAIIFSSGWSTQLRQAIGRRLGWGWKSWLVTHSATILLVSVVIQLLLLPVYTVYFGEVSLIAPVANVLLLTIAGLCVQASFLLLILGMALPGVAEFLFGVLDVIVGLIDRATAWIASSPSAVWRYPEWSLSLTALMMLILLFSPYLRHHREVQPRRSAWQFVPASIALALLFVWRPVPGVGDGTLRVWFLDVGQGDSILIRLPNGGAGIVDAGPDRGAWFLPEMIRQRGITRLDFAVATHADSDHIGGMSELLDAIPVSTLYVGGSLSSSAQFEELAEAARRLAIPVTTLRRGAELSTRNGDVRMEVLHPTEEFLAEGSERNEASIVLRIEYAARAILLTGDAERDAEMSMLDEGLELRSDVLKAGHHGSASSTSELFLERVQPGLGIISCGRNNRYNHPAPAVMERFAKRGIPVMRTDHDGTILIEVDAGGEMQISAMRATPDVEIQVAR